MSAAALVARLAQEGIDPALLAEVAQELFAGEMERKVLSERRENERSRKARSRDITGHDVTSQEVTSEALSPLAPPKVSPTPPTNTPPISPKPTARGLKQGIGLPDWLPPDPWRAFVGMRAVTARVAFTEEAAKRIVAKLDKLRGEGHDPTKLLDKAIERGWRTVFPDDDTKAARVATTDWEASAQWYEKYGKHDEAAECRRKYAASVGDLIRTAVDRAA